MEIIRNAPELGFHAVFKLNWVEEDVIPPGDCRDYSSLNPFHEKAWTCYRLIVNIPDGRYQQISELSQNYSDQFFSAELFPSLLLPPSGSYCF